MQQACVDDVLMSNYTELNDTASLISVTSRAVRNTIGFKCEPFDCNGNGHCNDSACVCSASKLTLKTFGGVIRGVLLRSSGKDENNSFFLHFSEIQVFFLKLSICMRLYFPNLQ